MNPNLFCPKCFGKTLNENELNSQPAWTRLRCIECDLRFLVLGKNLPWPLENGAATQQRDTALKALRMLGVTVREISDVVGLSENYVGQITKVPLQ